MFTDVHPTTDIAKILRHVRFVPTTEVQRFYSMTSSARVSRDAGMSRPSDFAVLRLMESRNFDGCSIGRSAGFAPLRNRVSQEELQTMVKRYERERDARDAVTQAEMHAHVQHTLEGFADMLGEEVASLDKQLLATIKAEVEGLRSELNSRTRQTDLAEVVEDLKKLVADLLDKNELIDLPPLPLKLVNDHKSSAQSCR
jgi:hypothetical protein